MPLKIGQRPDHGFDEPLGLLSDCHRRIEHFLRVLTTTADHLNCARVGDADRRQLEAALAYFATAAPRHTADEEDSLFPRMEASQDPNAMAVLALIRRLESDHPYNIVCGAYRRRGSRSVSDSRSHPVGFRPPRHRAGNGLAAIDRKRRTFRGGH